MACSPRISRQPSTACGTRRRASAGQASQSARSTSARVAEELSHSQREVRAVLGDRANLAGKFRPVEWAFNVAVVYGKRRYEVIDAECVGCNLCMHVCPVEDCISMVEVDNGKGYLNWKEDPRNPMNQKAAE